MARFLIVPQWQGSSSARAMLLVDGASAIAGDLPRSATTVLDVPLEAGDALGTRVHRLSALRQVRTLVAEKMGPGRPATETVLIGGDGGITVAALDAVDRHDLAVLWCSAHPALHTDATSPTGAFAGMALRAVLGEGEPQLALAPPVPPERVITVGARVIDDAEQTTFAALTHISPAQLVGPEALAVAVAATGAARVWVHIDVDVLDPAEINGVSDAVPFGATASALVQAIRAVRARTPLLGATICGFSPRTPLAAVDDLGAILRLVGAVA